MFSEVCTSEHVAVRIKSNIYCSYSQIINNKIMLSLMFDGTPQCHITYTVVIVLIETIDSQPGIQSEKYASLSMVMYTNMPKMLYCQSDDKCSVLIKFNFRLFCVFMFYIIIDLYS